MKHKEVMIFTHNGLFDCIGIILEERMIGFSGPGKRIKVISYLNGTWTNGQQIFYDSEIREIVPCGKGAIPLFANK